MHVTSSARAQASARMGFNGQLHEPFGAWQALGNGRRIHNPVLMRFHSPDELSPFARGGINAYAYCGCEPVNRTDPSGRVWKMMAIAAIFTGLTGALAAAGVAVSTKDDNQRMFAVLGIMTGLTVSAIAGKYVHHKLTKKPPPPNPETHPQIIKVRDMETQTDISIRPDLIESPMSPSAPPLSPAPITPTTSGVESRLVTPRRLSTGSRASQESTSLTVPAVAASPGSQAGGGLPRRTGAPPPVLVKNIRRQSMSEAVSKSYRRYSKYKILVI